MGFKLIGVYLGIYRLLSKNTHFVVNDPLKLNNAINAINQSIISYHS